MIKLSNWFEGLNINRLTINIELECYSRDLKRGILIHIEQPVSKFLLRTMRFLNYQIKLGMPGKEKEFKKEGTVNTKLWMRSY